MIVCLLTLATPPPVDNLSLSHPGNRELIAITPTGDFCSYRYHTPAIVHMHLSLSHRALFVCALIAITIPNLRKMHLSLSQCRKQHVIAITHPKSYQLEGGLLLLLLLLLWQLFSLCPFCCFCCYCCFSCCSFAALTNYVRYSC